MKKILLSALVIVSFALYAFHRSHEDVSQVMPQAGALPATSQNTTNPPDTTGQSQNTATSASASYKDGSFTGSLADAFYGYVQVMAIVKGGRITDVQFLRYPNDQRNSVAINQQAMPYLTQEAVQAQSAEVDVISGATDTSYAFRQSLTAALAGAKI